MHDFCFVSRRHALAALAFGLGALAAAPFVKPAAAQSTLKAAIANDAAPKYPFTVPPLARISGCCTRT